MKSYTCTTNIFQLPSNFYSKIIKSLYFKDTGKSVDIEEIAANRNDYDYMKDLKQQVGQGKFMNFKTFNGDIITVHKSKSNLF